MEYKGSRLSFTNGVLLLLIFLVCFWEMICGQMHYAITEDSVPGAVVGNIVKDLGLHLQGISGRNLRVVSKSNKQYFKINSKEGVLILAHKIDREEICDQSSTCLLYLQLLLENPLELHSVKVDIVDINDNSPQFPAENITLEIIETANVGTSFELAGARDPDIGINSLSTYWLTPNEYFALRVKTRDDGTKVPEIVLQKSLDRERQAAHQLILTAVDGGDPAFSGTVTVSIKVFDINDNPPAFNQSTYNVRLNENSPIGTVVIHLKATDPDDGINGEIDYSFRVGHISNNAYKVFRIDAHTGEVRTNYILDFEETKQYTFEVKARDRGSPAAEDYCTVNVMLSDINDNAPEVVINSLTNPIPEDAVPGSVVALISVSDSDFGENGRTYLHIDPNIPFRLVPSFEDHYSLVTKEMLDRETTPYYNITIKATDSGSPSQSTQKLLFVEISDVNDNSPQFLYTTYTTHVQENNHPGLYLCSMIASDHDQGKNAKLLYSIAEQKIGTMHVSSYFYLNPENGSLYSARSFDYEEAHVFQIQIQVEDAGTPPLRGNVTVHIFIIDQNDNAPKIIYPKSMHGSLIHQSIPRSAQVGFLVTKVVGVDEDSGHNAWLSYRLQPSDDSSEFLISPHSGEIRTAKILQDLSETTKKITVEVKDNGKPSLSTSVTILLSLEDNRSEGFSGFRDDNVKSSVTSDVTFYLIISLIAVSFVSLLTFTALAINCIRNRKGNTSCPAAVWCCCREQSLDTKYPYNFPTGSLRIQLNPDGPLKYVEVRPTGQISQHENLRLSFPSPLDADNVHCMKPESATNSNTYVEASFSGNNHLDSSVMQTQPNTDWRFSQAPRPGTSGTGGSQHLEEVVGPWPTNQMESERIQAMMAAANEITDAISTLGAGTLGLSARYGPQFTLQHVPDYRQNVYIPGSTATLNNSSGKKDGKGATSSGGHKRKSGKKDKK